MWGCVPNRLLRHAPRKRSIQYSMIAVKGQCASAASVLTGLPAFAGNDGERCGFSEALEFHRAGGHVGHREEAQQHERLGAGVERHMLLAGRYEHELARLERD